MVDVVVSIRREIMAPIHVREMLIWVMGLMGLMNDNVGIYTKQSNRYDTRSGHTYDTTCAILITL